MKEYRCVKPLRIEQYDADGYWQPCKQIEIKQGVVFHESRRPLQIASAPAVRLENKDFWLELMPDTLAEHFEEMRK